MNILLGKFFTPIAVFTLISSASSDEPPEGLSAEDGSDIQQAYVKTHLALELSNFPKDKSLVPEKYTERNGTIKKQYGVKGYPTFVLLKPDGKTELGRLNAGKEKTPESFINEVKALLNTEEGK